RQLGRQLLTRQAFKGSPWRNGRIVAEKSARVVRAAARFCGFSDGDGGYSSRPPEAAIGVSGSVAISWTFSTPSARTSRSRPRLTRLLMVPTAQLQIFAASS